MKQNTIVLATHPFFQVLEHGVEHADPIFRFTTLGNSRYRLGTSIREQAIREINADVAKWRIDSIKSGGNPGVPCPCRKPVAPAVNDEELSLTVPWTQEERRTLVDEFRRREVNPAWRDAPYPPDEAAFRAALSQTLRAHQAADRRDAALLAVFSASSLRAFRTSEQAFAMLGGYRPDRHGPWINPAWVSANPLADEQ